MVEHDRARFSQCMTLLSEIFGAVSALKLQAYWMALLEYDIRDVEAAAIRCLKTRKSSDGYPAPWPTPADLIALMYRGLNDDSVADPPLPTPQRVALPGPTPDPEAEARIRTLLRETVQGLPSVHGTRPTSGPVVTHAARLTARGLVEEAAWRHAEAMVADPAHRANCAICHPAAGTPWETP